ncbi:MAG: homoserine kinase [Burkholderiaceae bacterium]|nr:homoserine kinase [Burkholderiaceae bacterium]
MAVFTEVSREDAAELMRRLHLGTLTDLKGIAGGIENTNYFADTERDGQTHHYVLTLFERLTHEQLPFYLYLMQHLATKGIPVPAPAADSHGDILHTVGGKPAAVVNKLLGRSELAPTADHCAQVGAMLARMHLAGQDYPRHQPNLRGLDWWNETVPVVLPHVSADQAVLLESELAYQNQVATSPTYLRLPRGPVHADLFRDNVMFHEGRLSGFFDFYFAGCDTWLFDLAVCLNDWCIDLPTGAPVKDRELVMLQAYESVRPLTQDEQHDLPAMKRAGAFRFWVSRLWDWYLPREASMLKPHDPTHFERVLRHRIQPL